MPLMSVIPSYGRIQMTLTCDTEAALRMVVALINSAANREDRLATSKDLAQFLEAHGFPGARTRDHAELVSFQSLRAELRRLWTADEDTAAEGVNSLLRRANVLPQLVRHDDWGWHLLPATDNLLLDRVGAEAARALGDLIRCKKMERMLLCAADDCDAVVLDFSRNRSRRFCENGCANRAHVAAYRERRASNKS